MDYSEYVISLMILESPHIIDSANSVRLFQSCAVKRLINLFTHGIHRRLPIYPLSVCCPCSVGGKLQCFTLHVISCGDFFCIILLLYIIWTIFLIIDLYESLKGPFSVYYYAVKLLFSWLLLKRSYPLFDFPSTDWIIWCSLKFIERDNGMLVSNHLKRVQLQLAMQP